MISTASMSEEEQIRLAIDLSLKEVSGCGGGGAMEPISAINRIDVSVCGRDKISTFQEGSSSRFEQTSASRSGEENNSANQQKPSSRIEQDDVPSNSSARVIKRTRTSGKTKEKTVSDSASSDTLPSLSTMRQSTRPLPVLIPDTQGRESPTEDVFQQPSRTFQRSMRGVRPHPKLSSSYDKAPSPIAPSKPRSTALFKVSFPAKSPNALQNVSSSLEASTPKQSRFQDEHPSQVGSPIVLDLVQDDIKNDIYNSPSILCPSTPPMPDRSFHRSPDSKMASGPDFPLSESTPVDSMSGKFLSDAMDDLEQSPLRTTKVRRRFDATAFSSKDAQGASNVDSIYPKKLFTENSFAIPPDSVENESFFFVDLTKNSENTLMVMQVILKC